MFYDDIDFDKIPDLSKKMESFFKQGRSINTTSYLNWRLPFNKYDSMKFWVFAESYFEAAYNLISICLKDNFDKKADSLIFPILFDIVHGIEVSLKAIIINLKNILGYNVNYGHIHSIKQLSNEVLARLNTLNKKYSDKTLHECVQAITLVCNFINIIYEKTNDMAFARYPINKKDKDMFYIAKLENVVIDLECLNENMGYVAHMLDFVFFYLCDFYQGICEERKN